MTQTVPDEILKQGEQWIENLPENWQTWLSENLARGCAPQELIHILKENGLGFQLDVEEAEYKPVVDNLVDHEMDHQAIELIESLDEQIIDLLLTGLTPNAITEQLAKSAHQPIDTVLLQKYVQGLQHSTVFKRLRLEHHLRKKREWLISTVDELHQLDSSYINHIPRIKTPEFKTFIKDYYAQHRPVILTQGVSHWPAMQKWTPHYFAETIADGLIEVQMGRNSVKDFERKSPALKQMISMRDFVEKVSSAGESNDFYMTANNTQKSQSAIAPLYEDILDFGEGYCDLTQKNSLSFLWFGPKGTFTPLHHDLTNNMLVQIYGRKKVTLVPALQTPYLHNDRWVFSKISDLKNVDRTQYPAFNRVTPIECVLEAGEALFIPIGWWHTVESLDVSISVSFTHFTAKNNFSQNFPKAYDE